MEAVALVAVGFLLAHAIHKLLLPFKPKRQPGVMRVRVLIPKRGAGKR